MLATFLPADSDFLSRLLSLVGVLVFVGVAWLISVNRKGIKWKPVIWGVALQFILLDDFTKWLGSTFNINYINEFFQTTLGMFTSGLGAQLTWTLPFGLLIMFAVFNRFDKSYEEAARDLGASPWKTFKEVVFPLIAPSIIGIALFGFTLSYDELARSSQVMGAGNTLPLELKGLTTTVTTPVIYALGTVTTFVSFSVIGISIACYIWLKRKKG